QRRRPRVLVETPAPPVLREKPLERKRAGHLLPCFFFSSHESKALMNLTDKFGRPITDLRISITDRCNYKCVYCRTGNEGALYSDLPFSDYLRIARVFASLGIKKVRITGGEPLLRQGVVEFVRELASLRNSLGEPLDLTLTTNGHLLADLAMPLKAAGLRRVTVSMDAVDPERFARITRVQH